MEMSSFDKSVTPRHVLCVLGNWKNFDEVAEIVRQFEGFELDREFSQLTSDNRMMDSFEVCHDQVQPSMTEADWQAVREHTAVAYVLSPAIDGDRADAISGQALLLIEALLKRGATAAKGESPGVAHGRDRWIEMGMDYAKAGKEHDVHSQRATLYWAWVRRPLLDKEAGVYYSCGMQVLRWPDLEIDASLDHDEATKWMDLLGLYLVADKPGKPVKEGDGFRLTETGPRKIIHRLPCQRYENDDYRFNPFGYIRLVSDAR